MIFTLEALEAKHGDSLLLHHGPADSPHLVVIDGGPAGVYLKRLKPRLEELRQGRDPDAALAVEMLMVSHVDEDHVTGVLGLTKDLIEKKLRVDVGMFWHNSFDDLVKKVKLSSVDAAAARVADFAAGGPPPAGASVSRPAAVVLASVKQGRDLRLNAEKLQLEANPPFDDLVVARAEPVTLGDKLELFVLGPRQAQLDALQDDWVKKLAALKKAGKLTPADHEVAAAEFVDRSVYNLSSIVVLAVQDGQRMLLTGDARGDHILQSVEEADLLVDGRLEVELLKMPHHGSAHNSAPVFFETIMADHYVFSANGRDDNPDRETLKMLFDARPEGGYALHFTNDVPHVKEELAASLPANVEVFVRKDDEPSVRIDLDEPFTE